MKYTKAILYTLLFMGIPVLGMSKENTIANACMLYSNLTPTVPNMYCTLMQTGLVATHLIAKHSKVSPIIDKAAEKARVGAFVVPALIAYNSESIKNGIMDQLPEVKEPFNTCLDISIKKTLLYGGIALTGYLLYTQTWGGLTNRKLGQIFAPLMSKSELNKELAQNQYKQAIQTTKIVEKLQEQASMVKQKLEKAEEASALRNIQLNTRTTELASINNQNEITLTGMQKLLREINIPQLTSTVKEIEKQYDQKTKQTTETISKMHADLAANSQKVVAELKNAMQVHSSRSAVNQMMTSELESDVDIFFIKVITLANTIFANQTSIKYALELTSKIEKQADELDQSDSSNASDDDSEDDEFFGPRGQGSSKR